ncbi:hypothetical protein [Antribacter gilvus]|uniref:hypothetical protein n=1 Tax=Antribacter gilvus TaxID=2304675 RepID=UPI000F78711E|nr:hypothetical protein [Antribacter gilvus]
MARSVYILFDTYYPEQHKRRVEAVFTSREAAEAEQHRLLSSGGTFAIEEHDLLDRVEVDVRRVPAAD